MADFFDSGGCSDSSHFVRFALNLDLSSILYASYANKSSDVL